MAVNRQVEFRLQRGAATLGKAPEILEHRAHPPGDLEVVGTCTRESPSDMNVVFPVRRPEDHARLPVLVGNGLAAQPAWTHDSQQALHLVEREYSSLSDR